MKFIIETTKLHAALKRLGKAVNSKPLLPVIENILVTVLKKQIMLTTTDLQITISIALDCETEGKGIFLLPYKELKEVLDLSPNEPVTVTYNDKTGAVATFETSTIDFSKVGDATEFPKFTEVEDDAFFAPGDDIVGAMALAALSVSKDNLRPAMCAICVELSKDWINVTSTDAHSVFNHALPATLDKFSNPNDKVNLLVPPVVADVLEGLDEITLAYTKSHVVFKAGQIMVTATMVDAQFPEWRAVMPAHHTNVETHLLELKIAAKKAWIFSDSSTNGIYLNIEARQIRLNTRNEDTAQGADCRITAAYEGEPLKVRFNGKLLDRTLDQLKGQQSNQVQIMVRKPNQGVSFKIEGCPNTTVVLMPING